MKPTFLHEYEEAKKNAEYLAEIKNPEYWSKYKNKSFREFWDMVGLKLEYFDYEQMLEQKLIDGKYLWVKKATGLGVTEFTLRWIAWNCVKNDDYKNNQLDVSVVIITGPNMELSQKLIHRLKDLFDLEFKEKTTVCYLNGARIEAFPSHHLAAARGLNPKIVFLDEADFFPIGQQVEARSISERYIAKTNPHIIMVSTPNNPGGLFETMETEEPSMYERLKLDYTIGINKIYTDEQLAIAKTSPTFEREYNLQYGYGIGDVFEGIDDIIEKYPLDYLGGRAGTYADPGFGSSKFGKVAGEVRDGIVYVTEAQEYERESPITMLDVMEESWNRHKQACKVDASNPGFIKALTERSIPALGIAFGEHVPETEGLTRIKQDSIKSETTTTLKKKLPIIASQMVKSKLVRIHPDFKSLISQMRAVKFDKMGGIDKSEVPFDLVDAFDMMLWDMQGHDYSSIGLTYDGKIIDKVKKNKGSVIMSTRIVE